MPLPTVLVGMSFAMIVPLIVKLLLAFGVGFVVYTGVGFLLDQFRTQVFDHFSALPEIVFSIAVIAGLDQAINIILSAIATGAAIKGLSVGGSLKTMRFV